ncbi:MAG: hypothetical protein ACJ71K_18640 [Nitrososphaeraceae archaeon]
MERYARIIQESQYDLGLEVSSFDNIGCQHPAFYGKLYRRMRTRSIKSRVSN